MLSLLSNKVRRQFQKMIQFVTIHRISQLQVTKCYDPARQPTRYRSNITRTAMNELLGVQTRGFDRFPTRRKDFFSHFPSFRLGETSN